MPPSAELRPDQTDQDSLPPYDVIDGIIEAYVEKGKSLNEIIDLGYSKTDVQHIVNLICKMNTNDVNLLWGFVLPNIVLVGIGTIRLRQSIKMRCDLLLNYSWV